jgi:hypothetical protein
MLKSFENITVMSVNMDCYYNTNCRLCRKLITFNDKRYSCFGSNACSPNCQSIMYEVKVKQMREYNEKRRIAKKKFRIDRKK